MANVPVLPRETTNVQPPPAFVIRIQYGAKKQTNRLRERFSRHLNNWLYFLCLAVVQQVLMSDSFPPRVKFELVTFVPLGGLFAFTLVLLVELFGFFKVWRNGEI